MSRGLSKMQRTIVALLEAMPPSTVPPTMGGATTAQLYEFLQRMGLFGQTDEANAKSEAASVRRACRGLAQRDLIHGYYGQRVAFDGQHPRFLGGHDVHWHPGPMPGGAVANAVLATIVHPLLPPPGRARRAKLERVMRRAAQ